MKAIALILVMSAAFPTPAACAGSFAGPNYSGGTCYAPGPDGTPGPQPDASYNGGWGGGSGGGKSANCGDPIKTTFTWNPTPGQNDPPPQSVITIETSKTDASGASYPPGAVGGSCADGFGHTQSLTQTPIYAYPGSTQQVGTSGSATLGGTRYGVKPGNAVSLTCTPTAGASASSTASSDLTYTVGISPVTIKITSTYDPDHGDYRVLTGQRITATLQGVGGFTVTGYTWSVGGDAFKNYDPTLASGQLVPLGPADLSGPASGHTTVAALSFCDKKAEGLSVTCTATLTAPDGTSLSVSATAPQITVLKPTASWQITPGYVYLKGSVTGYYGSPDATVYTNGQNWHDVAIMVPSPFSGGIFCFAQLVTPDRKVYRNLPPGSTASGYYQLLGNGITALDGDFPYGSTYPASPSPSGLLDGDSPVLAVPGANIRVSVADGGGSAWYKSTGSDQLQTWLMYQPAHGVWVPLQKYSWNWAGEQDIVYGSWICEYGDPLNPPPYSASNTDTPPQWSSTLAGGQLVSP